MSGDSPKPVEDRWKMLCELVEDLSRQRCSEGAIDTLVADAQELVPADRGLAIMKMEGRIPYCIRWPEYADPLISLFNSYLNRHSPLYYESFFGTLPQVDWKNYQKSEYHNEFNVPLGIRHTIGVGIRDFSTRTQYALFAHRSPAEPPFKESDVIALGSLRTVVSNVLTLVSSSSIGYEGKLRQLESERGCEILSPREREIAQLICCRLTMSTIASRIGISPRTVERHALHIYQKLNLSGRRELIRHCESPGS